MPSKFITHNASLLTFPVPVSVQKRDGFLTSSSISCFVIHSVSSFRLGSGVGRALCYNDCEDLPLRNLYHSQKTYLLDAILNLHCP